MLLQETGANGKDGSWILIGQSAASRMSDRRVLPYANWNDFYYFSSSLSFGLIEDATGVRLGVSTPGAAVEFCSALLCSADHKNYLYAFAWRASSRRSVLKP